MISVSLTKNQRRQLQYRLKHPGDLDAKLLPRLQCILLRDKGMPPRQIAATLQIHRNTVTAWVKLWQAGGQQGLLALHYPGNHRYLTSTQEKKLAAAIDRGVFSRIKDIEAWIESRCKVRYSETGLAKLVERIGFVKTQTGIIPAQANPRKQRAFLKEVSQTA